jgi:hypothetical protein
MSASGSQTRPAIPTCFARRVSLSRAEVAETLGCSQDFVDSLIADGKLRPRTLRTRVFIPAFEVWALLGITESVGRGSAEARSILRELEV